jgi:HD-GYP domain-containing protein (c-di-GMP phosphodiesterase class II)
MVLARPIPLPHDSRRHLLQRDVEIPLDLVPRLIHLGVHEVWVRHRDLEFLDEIFDEAVSDRQREVYAHVRHSFEAVMRGATVDLDISLFEDSIAGLFACLKGNRHGNVLLHKLDSFDNYLMSHSTNVCYLAMLLGMRLDRYLIDERSFKSPRDARNLEHLGLGCLLHDVGKMRMPERILNKPTRLTLEETAVMQKHPTVGHEMVKGKVPPAAADVVLCHHQRWDGNGYPRRKDPRTGELSTPMQGRWIPVFSRIATVADVYDAATSARCYSLAKLPVKVLHEMRTWCRGFFDPTVERAFYEIIPPFPLGQVVTLSNRMEAVVVDFNPRCPTRPRVQCLRTPSGQQFDDPALEEIDLAECPALQIAWVNGVDVRPFQESQPTADAATLEPALA